MLLIIYMHLRITIVPCDSFCSTSYFCGPDYRYVGG